jgi:hypothetical protein
MKRLFAALFLLSPLAASACDELTGVFGFQMQGLGFGEYFIIRKVDDSYVVFANQNGKWELTPNSFLYTSVQGEGWIDRVSAGDIPVCALEMLNGNMFGAYREKKSGKLVYFSLVGSSGLKTPMLKTRPDVYQDPARKTP